MLYLLPALPLGADKASFDELIDRSRVKVVVTQKLYEMLERDFSDTSVTLIVVTHPNIGILAKNASTLLRDLPTMLLGVPGVNYPPQWSMCASYFDQADWLELERKLLKSAQRPDTPEDVSHNATMILGDDTPAGSFSQFRAEQSSADAGIDAIDDGMS